MRRVHPLTYPVARQDSTRALKLHSRRDCSAALLLLSRLYRQGFELGEPIFNQPPRHPPKAPVPFGELYRLDRSFVLPDDLLLQTTRPPIHDREAGPQKQVERACTDLEFLLFEAWRAYLEYCARTDMRLALRLRGSIRQGFENRREMAFKQKGWGASYSELNALEGHGWHRHEGKRRTALFLLRLAHAWENGPGYLCAFGMDGCTTLIWAYRLVHDLAQLLEEPGFVLAEMELGKLPERATDLRFSLDWKIEVLVHHQERQESRPASAARI